MPVAETAYEHIILNEDQVPMIEGTTMKVIELVQEHLAWGWSPEELYLNHSYLTLGQIHSAWDVLGDGKTVLRGGYGVYYPDLLIRQTHGNTTGFSNTGTSYNAPGGNANFPALQLKDGFPSPPIQPLGAALGPGAFLGQAFSYDEPDGTSPYSQQFTLSLQRQLPGAWLFEIGYSGNVGHHFIAGSYDLSILSKIGGSRKMPGRKIALNLRGLIFLPHIFLLKPGPVRDTPPRIFETIPI
jgi:uncharacterized protein (DUF433 family)